MDKNKANTSQARVLFQGDSITDAGRKYQEPDDLGLGYPYFAAETASTKYPGKFKYINRGVGGNRSIDLLARVKADIINLKPDYMSILIGVNDVWHEFDEANPNGVDNEKYKLYYRMLLQQVKEALPEIKIVIMEPYVLKGTDTEGYYEEFRSEVELRAKSARELAEEFNLPFIPMQEKLDKAFEEKPIGYWTLAGDGVHPTTEGHKLIASLWMEEFDKFAADK